MNRAPTRSVSQVAVGLVAASLLTYAFQAVASRSLNELDFGSFGAAWSLFFLILIVGYLGVEQTLAARVARSELPVGSKRSVAIGVGLAVGVGASLFLLGIALGPPLTLVQWSVLAAGAMGYLPAYSLRGLASGGKRFTLYGSMIATEAAIRLAVVGLVSLVGDVTLDSFVLGIAVAPWLAAAVFGGTIRVAGWSQAASPIRLGSVGALGVSNASLAGILGLGPVLVGRFGVLEEAGLLFAGLVLVRVPLYYLQSVTVTLIASAAEWVKVEGRQRAFRRIARLAGGLAGAGVILSVAAFPVAERLVTLFFGEGRNLESFDYAILGIGVSLIIGNLVLQQLAVVLRAERRLGVSWSVGLAIFVLCVFLFTNRLSGAIVGLPIAAGTTAVLLSVSLVRASRQEA